ncbi:translocation/assembly module TamB domain-containing protein [Thiohalorhabdus denitrificans]|uniref:Autotransporter secretion inner membrane protein TamB n=1 Tax=Thiohalorhabdus denitrificans TaxID=381306 RepID=A0A1G5GHG1_9GAMM|nr:translocation/assembly module TamB domain-containing protein [Thiohalorhabdus denitrificans]SCY50983.1 autotransporter secretion inner membrane protein TamB [Thiohalorhabdus denitrificans]
MRRRWIAFWIVLAALLGGGAFLLLTETGLQWTWRLVRPALPEGLEVASVEGRLVGPVRVRDATLETASFRARMARGELDWRASDLLRGRITVSRLIVEDYRYTALPGAPEPEPETGEGPTTSAFLPVRIEDARFLNGEIRGAPDAEPTLVTALTGAVGIGPEGLYWDNLELETPELEAWSGGRIDHADDAPDGVAGSLGWTLRLPDQPEMAGRLEVSGTLQALEFDHRVTRPWAVATTGRIDDPLEEPRWEARITGEDLDLRTLGPGLPAGAGDLDLRLHGSTEDLEASGGVDLRLPERPPLHLEVDLAGNLPERAVDIRELLVTAEGLPARLSARGRVAMPAEGPEVDLRGDWRDLRWPLEDEAAPWQSAQGNWRAFGDWEALHARMEGALGDGDFHAAATYQGGPLGLAINWHNLRWPGPRALASPRGHATLAGTMEDYRLRLDAAGRAEELPDLHLTGRARGGPDSLDLQSLRLEALEGTLEASGDVGWGERFAADLALRGRDLNPGPLLPQWPGALDMEAGVQAEMSPEGPAAEVSDLLVEGRLRGRPVRVSGSGAYGGGALELTRLRLRSGASTLAAEGRVGEELDLAWNISSDDLEEVHPEAGGTLHGEGRVTGRLPLPRVSAELTGEGLRWGESTVEGVELEAEIHPRGAAPSRLKVAVRNARAGDTRLATLALEGRGTPDDHAIRLDLDSSQGQADLRTSGSWREAAQELTFRLEQAHLRPANLPDWRLEAPVEGAIGAATARLGRGCWSDGEGRLCLEGERGPEEVHGALAAQGIPLGYLLPLLPPDTGIEGTLSASGTFTMPTDGPPTGRMTVVTSAGRILQTGDAEALNGQQVLELRPSWATAEIDGQRAVTDFALNLGDDDRLTAHAELGLGEGPMADQPLSGRLRGAITDLEPISIFAPDIQDVDGALRADLRVDGTVAEPRPSGELGLQADTATLVPAGLTIRNFRLVATPESTRSISLQGHAESGEGSLDLAGAAAMGEDGPTADLAITGEDFLAYDTTDIRVWISPDLKVEAQRPRVDVTGTVRIPRAEIEIKELPASGVVQVSEDQVLVTEEDEVEGVEPPWEVSARVRVVLGDLVRFEGFGLKTRIVGDLTVQESPGQPTTATGEVRTEEGEYKAYGQDLEIRTGRLVFGGGPVSSPGLEVRAVRTPRPDITVGVEAKGPLREPEFSLFSEPGMSQTEQLSWLVLGRPLDQASRGEQSALSQAAILLGRKGGQFLAETIGEDLGLDEVSLEAQETTTEEGEQTEEAALVLGKYLSPRLYVSYGIGLFDSANTFRMTYTLARHWRLVTESSAQETGGDLFYTIESGGD